jgi:hypothetical protein
VSDFPEFDAQYQTILVKDKEDRFEQLAAEANFNVYHSDIWRGTGRRFAELIVRECAAVANKTVVGSDFVGEAIHKHFGVD